MRLDDTLSLSDLVVLCLLVEQPQHGFAVARELRPDSGIGQVWTVHRPLVYRAIEHLLGAGLVEPTHQEPGAQGPSRTIYRATRKGRDRARQWLARPVAHPRDARTELLVKFMLLARTGRPLAPLARTQLDRFQPLLERLDATAGAAEGSDQVVAWWRVESLRATTTVLRRIVDGAPPA